MGTALDLTGQRFGRLMAEECVGKDIAGKRLWKCRCDCGESSIAIGSQLKSGHTRSCGCLQPEVVRKTMQTHGMYRTPIYSRWQAMIARATNPNTAVWKHYGGRGITVCDRWRSFENFAADMGATFDPDLQLERINNDGPYSPENCRWATSAEQHRNQRTNRLLELDGLTLTIKDWSQRLGINPQTIRGRLDYGWSVEQALTPGNGNSGRPHRVRV